MPDKSFTETIAADISAEENAGLTITITSLGANGFEIRMAHPSLQVGAGNQSLRYRTRQVASLPAGFKAAADSELGDLLTAAGYA